MMLHLLRRRFGLLAASPAMPPAFVRPAPAQGLRGAITLADMAASEVSRGDRLRMAMPAKAVPFSAEAGRRLMAA